MVSCRRSGRLVVGRAASPVAGRGGGVVAGKFEQVSAGGVEPVVVREPGVGLLRIPDVAQV